MEKNQILLSLITLLLPCFLLAQNIGVDKLKTHSGSGWDLVSDMAIDTDGNYYITGSFSGQINVDGTLINSSGMRDIFIVKLNNENEIQWVKNYGGVFDEHSHSISCHGNLLYLSGSFNNTLTLKDAMQATGGTDAFFAQLNQDGEPQWAKAMQGTSSAHKVILKNDNQGNIILGGNFRNTLKLDASTSLTAQSELDVYWAKYDASGNLQVYVHLSGDGDEKLNDIVIDQSNNVYLGGGYEKNLKFSRGTVVSYGKLDIFTVKYNTNGEQLWYRIAGGPYNDEVKALTLDGQGNLYSVIEFELSMNIGRDRYRALAGSDVVIIKGLESNGAAAWVRQLGGNSKNSVSSATYGNGKLYFTGSFRGQFQSDDEYKSEGVFEDAYVASYADDGTFSWFNKAGGSKEDNIWIKYQPQNQHLIGSGFFSDDFTFGPHQSVTNEFSDLFFGALIDCDLAPKVNLGPDRTICSGTEIWVEGEFVSYTWEHGSTTSAMVPETSGTYAVVVEDKYGCSSSDAIDVVINSSPEFELGADVLLPAEATLFLDPGISGANYSYEWSTGAIGATLNIPMVSFNNIPTIVSLTITDGSNSCQFSDELLVSTQGVIPPKSIPLANNSINSVNNNEIGAEQEMRIPESWEYMIYPNPTKGKLLIDGKRLEKAKQIDIFNISGHHIISYQQITNAPFEINLSDYPKGTYLVKISETQQVFDFRIILE